MTILFDGVAYGMLLFILAVGLSVTLGLMNFINLAHGAFAMAGGYVAVILAQRAGVSLFGGMAIAFVATALAGAVLERTLYKYLYDRSHLDQVLFTIGLTFMAMAAADYFMGASPQIVNVPDALNGRIHVGALSLDRYRLFVIILCGLLTLGLQAGLTYTRFGARLRASVDNARAARGLGIDVTKLFTFTFAIGCGLAGLGGALGAPILSIDPGFPIKYMIYFLIVIAVGGTSTITGPFLAALLLGIADVTGKYYAPEIGGFIIYTIMVLVLIVRPQGLFGRMAKT